MHGVEGTVIAAAVLLAAFVSAFDKFGLLERFGLRKQSVVNAASELAIAAETIRRLTADLGAARSKASQLELERTNEPVLELIAKVMELSQATLEKLASFNGSLKHIEASLGDTRDGLLTAAEGMKALTGTIAELHDLPLTEPRRRTA